MARPRKKNQPSQFSARRITLGLEPCAGEPHLADFFRQEVPTKQQLIESGAANQLAEFLRLLYPTLHNNITAEIAASEAHRIALWYKQGKGIENTLSDYRQLAAAGRLSETEQKTLRLHRRKDGRPRHWGDEALIRLVAEFLQKMNGTNKGLGWGYWNDYKETRERSKLQKAVEEFLATIDPTRKNMPPGSYYSKVKAKLGLVASRRSRTDSRRPKRIIK